MNGHVYMQGANGVVFGREYFSIYTGGRWEGGNYVGGVLHSHGYGWPHKPGSWDDYFRSVIG